jgi:hypothetical protein
MAEYEYLTPTKRMNDGVFYCPGDLEGILRGIPMRIYIREKVDREEILCELNGFYQGLNSNSDLNLEIYSRRVDFEDEKLLKNPASNFFTLDEIGAIYIPKEVSLINLKDRMRDS